MLMRVYIKFVTKILLVYCHLFLAGMVFAEGDKLQYVVIDFDKVITQSDAYKNFKILWDRENNKYQKEIEFYELQIVELDKQISANQETLNHEVLTNLKKQLSNNEIKVQKLIQKRKIYLDEIFADAIEQLRIVIIKIIRKYSERNNLKLVIPKSYTIYIDKNIDITDKILHSLNQELTKINTKLR